METCRVVVPALWCPKVAVGRLIPEGGLGRWVEIETRPDQTFIDCPWLFHAVGT